MGKQKIDSQKSPHRQRYFSLVRRCLAKLSAAALTFGLILLTVVGPAAATIVYVSDPQNIQTGMGGGPVSYPFLNYNAEGNQFSVTHTSYMTPVYWEARLSGNTSSNVAAAYGNNLILNLSLNNPINGSLPWKTEGYLATGWDSTPTIIDGFWAGYGKGYAGLQFTASDGLHYGWAELEVAGDLSSVTLFGYAYETEVDKSLLAGALPGVPVPVPGAVWLLGSGLLGLTGFRRFRKS
jgi:hypothetical protein